MYRIDRINNHFELIDTDSDEYIGSYSTEQEADKTAQRLATVNENRLGRYKPIGTIVYEPPLNRILITDRHRAPNHVYQYD